MSVWGSIGDFASNNWGDLLKTGASLASTAGGIYAASQAADAQQDAARQSTAAQQQIYRQNRQDLAPYRAAGYGALDRQTSLLGLGVDPEAVREAAPWLEGREGVDYARPGRVDWMRENRPEAYDRYVTARNQNITNRLRQLPGYQFRMDEGVEALDRSAAARGMALSGAHMRDLTEFGQGLADQTYGNQLNRLASVAGTGQTATTNTARMGQNFGAQAGRNALAAGDARASSYGAMARQGNNLLNNLDYIWGRG